MVFNTIFNHISVISWRSVLLVEDIWRKPPTCLKSLTNLSHNVIHLTLIEIQTHNISGERHCVDIWTP